MFAKAFLMFRDLRFDLRFAHHCRREKSSGLQCMVKTSTYRYAQLTVTTAGGSRRVQQLKRLSRTELNLQELTDICYSAGKISITAEDTQL